MTRARHAWKSTGIPTAVESTGIPTALESTGLPTALECILRKTKKGDGRTSKNKTKTENKEKVKGRN